MDVREAAQRWADALRAPTDEHKEALAPVLAEGVVAVSPLGAQEGREAVLHSVGSSLLADQLAAATWSEPVSEGAGAVLTARFGAGAPVGGVSIRLGFDGEGRIARVETTLIPGPPPTPVPIALTDAMRDAVNGALANRTPVMVAYADAEGQPHLSFRGTTQAHGPSRLAMWIRDPKGGLLTAIETNPRLALMYRDPATRTTYQFHGRARAEPDPEEADAIYEQSPELERNMDPQRRGVAVVIDLDRVEGRDAGGPVLMVRGADAEG